MKKFLIVATALIAGSAALAPAYAQDRGSQTRPEREHRRQHARLTAQDLTSFAEQRIAALHGGLRLTPEQEKLWPALETALKEVSQARIARIAAARPATPAADAAATPAPGADAAGPRDGRRAEGERQRPDAMAMLNARADRLARQAERDTARAADLRKIATAASPLYATLDPAQKRWLRSALRDQADGAFRGERHGKRSGDRPSRH